MPTNAELRTIVFSNGTQVDLPPGVLDSSGKKIVVNNAADQASGISFADNVYREVIFDFSIHRRTDDTTGLIERGRFRFTANPDALLDDDRWIISYDNENDEGTPTGVTFGKQVTVDDDVATVEWLISSTNLAGTNHDCVVSYALTSFLV